MVRTARILGGDYEDFDRRSQWPVGSIGGVSKLQADQMEDEEWAAEIAKHAKPAKRLTHLSPPPPPVAVDDGEELPELGDL